MAGLHVNQRLPSSQSCRFGVPAHSLRTLCCPVRGPGRRLPRRRARPHRCRSRCAVVGGKICRPNPSPRRYATAYQNLPETHRMFWKGVQKSEHSRRFWNVRMETKTGRRSAQRTRTRTRTRTRARGGRCWRAGHAFAAAVGPRVGRAALETAGVGALLTAGYGPGRGRVHGRSRQCVK